MELPVFYAGSAFDAHQYLGGRLTGEGAVFRTFAPSAEKISLIGEFSGWAELPMERVCDGNFWERTVPGARAGMMYKFRVYQRDGRVLDRCDPYGYYMELRPNSASILWDHAAQEETIQVLFSGSRSGRLVEKLEEGLKQLVFRQRPQYAQDEAMHIFLSYSVYGAYFAYTRNRDCDPHSAVELLGRLSQAAKELVLPSENNRNE